MKSAIVKFNEFNLDERLEEGLSYMGFIDATPIQKRAIPHILEKKDVLACAQTGTGKTAAFILPVLHELAKREEHKIGALVIAPTRELALQIEQQIQAFAYFVDVSSISVYGGGTGPEFDQQKNALIKGTDVIVGTPGKLISHINMGYVNFTGLRVLILDEADRMLDMGFFDDIQRIASHLPEGRQTLMFSATMPHKIRTLAKNILKDPIEISIAISKPVAGVLQAAYLTYESQKARLLRQLIDEKPNYKSILVFTSTKKKVGEIIRVFRGSKYDVQAVSSDLDQKERESALRKFRARQTRVLVATDVLSRGIDIKDINLVINYDVPSDAEDYVHRIGRTARADTTGIALSFITEDDMFRFNKIEQLIEKEVMKIPLPSGFDRGPKWDPTKQRMPRGRYSRKPKRR